MSRPQGRPVASSARAPRSRSRPRDEAGAGRIGADAEGANWGAARPARPSSGPATCVRRGRARERVSARRRGVCCGDRAEQEGPVRGRGLENCSLMDQHPRGVSNRSKCGRHGRSASGLGGSGGAGRRCGAAPGEPSVHASLSTHARGHSCNVDKVLVDLASSHGSRRRAGLGDATERVRAALTAKS